MENNDFFTLHKEKNSLVAEFLKTCTKIDAKNYSDIEDEAIKVISDMSEEEFVFDLQNIVYVSSAGLRMFSVINNLLQESGIEYRLINLTDDILNMFKLTGYSSMFKVEGQQKY